MHDGPNILFVHGDQPDLGSVLELRKAGHRVTEATGPAQAAGMLDERREGPGFDVVCFDVDADGHAALTLLESRAVSAGRTRALALTGFMHRAALDGLLGSGLDATLERPYTGRELREAVERLLAGRRAPGR